MSVINSSGQESYKSLQPDLPSNSREAQNTFWKEPRINLRGPSDKEREPYLRVWLPEEIPQVSAEEIPHLRVSVQTEV